MTEQLAKRDANVSMEKPDWLKDAGTAGTEHITRDDIQIPRVVLAQKMSKETDETETIYIEGLKAGMMFNGLTKEIYGRGPLFIQILRADPPRGVEFIPREEGGGVKDPNVPLDDPRMAFGPGGEKPQATKFYDFLIRFRRDGVFDGPDKILALSFKSTGLKVAKQLNAMIQLRNAPVWAGVYKLESVDTQNQHGKFAIFQISNAGWIEAADRDMSLQLFEALQQSKREIQRTPEDIDAIDVQPVDPNAPREPGSDDEPIRRM